MPAKKIIDPKKNKAAGLEFETRNCWEVYSSKAHRNKMEALGRRYLDFLSECKTERKVVRRVRELAEKEGFSEDFSKGKFLRVFRDKTILLARRGKKSLGQGFRLLGAHADAPRLDFKQHPLYEEASVGLAKTHYYGGIRKHQWFSRPLALHGVVVKNDGRAVDVCIGEDPKDPVFTVLDLLPHLAYGQMDKKLSKAFEAEKLNVVMGHAPSDDKGGKGDKKEKGDSNKKIKARVMRLLNERYGIVEEDLFSAEIQVVPAGPAREVGLDGSLIGGYAHDDRACVFASLEALLSSKAVPEYCQVAIFWDKEEIGSDGATGAKSLFMEYSLQDLIDAWSPGDSLRSAFLTAKAVSGDTHGGLDPDYQDLHEKLNASLLGHGPVFCKFTGHRGKYGASEATAEYVGWLRALLNKAGIPWQMAELGKVDLGGGGTVAKHLAVYGMDVIDFGPSVLGMHSPFEVLSKADLYATVLAYREFLESG